LTINSNKLIDIASHYDFDICVALTEDWVYVWGKCKGVNGETDIMSSKDLKQTTFKTIEQFYNNFLGITYKLINKLIDFKIKMRFTENGKYRRYFEEIKELGEGYYGKVFQVKEKDSSVEWAIKKIEFTSEKETKLLKEVQIFNTIDKKLRPNTVWFFDLWLENNCMSINGNKNNLILYIEMELCDTTLETVINQILNDSYICENNTLTLLGFYITSYIFVEILKGVNHLHTRKPQILHCDLHSKYILLKKHYNKEEEKYEIRVKISDFGLAKICELAQKSQTILPKSSSKYCLPQVSSDGPYTPKMDICALAHIMSQLFCIHTHR
jgi:serine/threonine protein kinase